MGGQSWVPIHFSSPFLLMTLMLEHLSPRLLVEMRVSQLVADIHDIAMLLVQFFGYIHRIVKAGVIATPLRNLVLET